MKNRTPLMAILALATLFALAFGGNVASVHAAKHITFIGSASSTTATNNAITVTYSSGRGHFIAVAVEHYPKENSCTVNSITDTGGSTYSLIAQSTALGPQTDLDIWGTAATGSVASTSVTVTVSSQCTIGSVTYASVAVSEYSNVVSLGQTVTGNGSQTDSGSGVTALCSVNQQVANDWLVTGFGIPNSSASITSGTGNLRQTALGNFGWVAIVDNSGSSTLPATINTSLVAHDVGGAIAWWGAGVELRTA